VVVVAVDVVVSVDVFVVVADGNHSGHGHDHDYDHGYDHGYNHDPVTATTFRGWRGITAPSLVLMAWGRVLRRGIERHSAIGLGPMKGFLLGLAVASLAFAGYLYREHRLAMKAAPAPELAGASASQAGKKTKPRARGAMRMARTRSPGETAAGSEPEAEPVRLSAADLHPVAQGDDLSTPDVLRLDMSNDKELPELSQDQIDERFRSQEPAILDCIVRSRPDPETYVPGRVIIKFRIQRAGTVRGVRVEAPAVLQKNGIFGCIKGVVGRLRFPAAGSSQILTYPFTLS